MCARHNNERKTAPKSSYTVVSLKCRRSAATSSIDHRASQKVLVASKIRPDLAVGEHDPLRARIAAAPGRRAKEQAKETSERRAPGAAAAKKLPRPATTEVLKCKSGTKVLPANYSTVL